MVAVFVSFAAGCLVAVVAVTVAVAVADHFVAVVDQIVGFVDAVYETFHFSFSSQVSQCTTRSTSTKGQQPMYR